MIEPKAHSERDVEINRVVTEIVRIVKDKGVEPDPRRKQWFANSQLDDVRKLLEGQGCRTASVYLTGKTEKRDNRWETVRNEALLRIVNFMGREEVKLDISICSYILGKLNSILDEAHKKEGRK
ncbi:MAG: hypothetical protein AABY54_10085 [Deltaproteobacteria bacterium]